MKTFTLNELGKRDNLEDAILKPKENTNYFVLCDGVGGSSGGEYASNLAVKCFDKVLKASAASIKSQFDFERVVRTGISLFKSELEVLISSNESLASTSTTVLIAYVYNQNVFVAWSGDSSLMHIRNGQILYKTKDHSLVQDLVNQGIIKEEEMRYHPNRNVIYKSLNRNSKDNDFEFDTFGDFVYGDWLLLCSDGLLEYFDEQQISRTLNDFDPSTRYDRLINEVCEERTSDNYSMVLVSNNIKPRFKLKPLHMFVLLGGVAVVATLLYLNTATKNEEVMLPDTNSQKSQFKSIIKKDSVVSVDSSTAKFKN